MFTVSNLISVPGLVPSDVALDDDGLLSEELKVPPAEESPDVPLDSNGCPSLGAAPLFLQLLIQELLEEHLAKDADVSIQSCPETSRPEGGSPWLVPAGSFPPLLRPCPAEPASALCLSPLRCALSGARHTYQTDITFLLSSLQHEQYEPGDPKGVQRLRIKSPSADHPDLSMK